MSNKNNTGFFNKLFKKNNQANPINQCLKADNTFGLINQAGGDINILTIYNIASDGKCLGGLQNNINSADCKKMLYLGEFDKLKQIYNNISINSECVSITNDFCDKIHYYRFLLSFICKESEDDRDRYRNELRGCYVSRAQCFCEINNKIDHVDIPTIIASEEEEQFCFLFSLFNHGKYCKISSVYERLDDITQKRLSKFWLYFVGLSYFNEQYYGKAAEVFKILSKSRYYESSSKQDTIVVFSYLSDLQEVTKNSTNCFENKSKLEAIFSEYNDVKKNINFTQAIVGYEKLVALIELQTILNIDLEHFEDEYSKYSSEIKNDSQILYLLGTYHELNKDYQEAYDIFDKLDWIHIELYLFKLMYIQLEKSNYADIISLYEKSADEARSARVSGIWLCAIKALYPEKYENEFCKVAEKYREKCEDLFALSISVDCNERDFFEKNYYPLLMKIMDDICCSDYNNKIRYIGLFIQFGHGTDALKILQEIDNTQIIDDQLGLALFQIISCYREWDSQKNEMLNDCSVQPFIGESVVTIQEALTDWFIENNIKKEAFLMIKINCLYDRGKIIDAVKYSKELYDITHDESVAANIIGLLNQENSLNTLDYKKYADVLCDSSEVRCLMASAIGYEKIGDYEKARFQIYKVIYKLNGSVDYDVIAFCFSLYRKMLTHFNDENNDKETIDGNVVVELSEIDNSDTHSELICLDSEAFVSDYPEKGRNVSMNLLHYSPEDSLYMLLYGKRIGDLITYNEKKYKVTKIDDRYFYFGKYIFSKIIECNENSDLRVFTIRTDDIEVMKKELLDSLISIDNYNSRDSINKLMNMYHFNDTEIGVPIESVISCDYSEYIEFIMELLHIRGQALYAGSPLYYKDYTGDYILSLPSLAIICVLSLKKHFDSIKNRIIIPKSLKMFIKQQISDMVETKKISPGKLIVTDDGNMKLLSKDTNVIDIWRDMYAFCDEVAVEEVSDEERSVFKIITSYDAENFYNKMKFDICQLDVLILAKKKSAVLLMDDLFFRRLAEYSNIRTTNSMFILYDIKDELLYDEALRLSKTNYIQMPTFLFNNMVVNMEYWSNLLDGERKRGFYSLSFASLIRNTNVEENDNC